MFIKYFLLPVPTSKSGINDLFLRMYFTYYFSFLLYFVHTVKKITRRRNPEYEMLTLVFNFSSCCTTLHSNFIKKSFRSFQVLLIVLFPEPENNTSL